MLSVFKDKYLWILFFALILLRLPTINRPLSKHHEFAVAVVLINAESWDQAGGGARFNYVPIMNYQGYANKVLDTGWHIDSAHNHIYLSFGAGWYVLPYFILKASGMPFTPLSLQILNIIISLITATGLYILLKKVTNNRSVALAGTALFALLPAPLWYGGNAYVANGIMMPFIIFILYLWHSFEKDIAQVRPAKLIVLLVSGLVLCYFDWIGVFFLAAMAVWGLVKLRTNHKYIWVTLFSTVSILIGISLVLAQFVSYLGWQQVLNYWKSRFAERSTDTSEFSIAQMMLMIIKNMITGYLPLFFVLPLFWIKRSMLKGKFFLSWPVYAFITIVPYNGVFFNWSAVHEFAWMAFGLMSCIIIAVYLLPALNNKVQLRLLGIFIGFSIVQYFIVNRPGTISWKGDRYNTKMKLGEWIKTNVDNKLPVFTNSPNDKITEFYSKRTFNSKPNFAEAKQLALMHGIKKAVWLQIDADTVTNIIPFETP